MGTKQYGMAVAEAGSATLSPSLMLRFAEIDGSTALTLSSSQVSSTVIHNVGQAAADVLHTLPTAAAGQSFVATVGTTQAANKWGFTAQVGNYIYLDGVIGSSGGTVKFAAPTIGDYMMFFTIKRASDYAWVCKTGYGTVTTE